ncbi:MAG: CoA transferase [Sphingobium sp.]|nr:MAG: CoA transferase [Sphingobium sp.]
MDATHMPKGPLAGIRVVDLTAMVFGPYATQIMADMGADVIKIEPPAGDATRYINAGPTPELGGVFTNVNRGKRSLVLDLRQEDYQAVKAIRPDIVYTNCYGYSRRGPDGDKPAYDDTIQAECGIPHLQQLMTGKPDFMATIIADKVAGLTGLYATMMALFHRERTGEGQEVEVSMFETMASFMLTEHASGMLFEPPLGPAHYHRVVARNRKPYATKDGHVAALVYNDKHWNAFVAAVNPPWATEEFDTLAKRAKQIDRVYGLLGGTFAERTTQEWLELLEALHIPAAPLRTTDELFDNAHLNAIGFFETVETPQGPVRFPGVPTWFSQTPGRVAGGAPELGAHSREVLDELGAAVHR